MYSVSRNSLVSIIKLKFDISGLISKIEIDDTSEKNSNANACMVSRIISTDNEYLQSEEFPAALVIDGRLSLSKSNPQNDVRKRNYVLTFDEDLSKKPRLQFPGPHSVIIQFITLSFSGS
ncbi:hypothetical protein V1478_004364 [Vespula squamosa]|uniref:Uncharacterized protein n=1 Tax=Vespula squamosa TaxID=30214 RepID=A0ABD2BHI4_VESSQ